MKIAVVCLNSEYACGAHSWLYHLTYNSDWTLHILGVHFDVSDVSFLEEYDVVLFEAPKWGGNYDFLRKLKLKRVGIRIHDINDFYRMGMLELSRLFPEAILFCADIAVKKIVPKAVMTRQPFSQDLMPRKSEISRSPRSFVSFTRATPSKNHLFLQKIVGAYPLRIIQGYTREELAVEFGGAVAMLDASVHPVPQHRTQYSFLESWYYQCPVLCFPEWFCDELYPEETCLELTYENIIRVWNDSLLCSRLVSAGSIMLSTLHDPVEIRKIVMESLL